MLSAVYYPVSVRSSAAGLASGAGKFGSIVGPVCMGVLYGMNLSDSTMYLVISATCIIGAIAVFALIKEK